MNNEILNFCVEKGFLVDSDLLEVFSETSDIESVKLIIERVKTYTHQNVLTKNLFERNKEQVNKFFLDLPDENKKNLERLRVKLGLSIEISKGNYIENSKENYLDNSKESSLGIPIEIEISEGKNPNSGKNNN